MPIAPQIRAFLAIYSSINLVCFSLWYLVLCYRQTNYTNLRRHILQERAICHICHICPVNTYSTMFRQQFKGCSLYFRNLWQINATLRQKFKHQGPICPITYYYKIEIQSHLRCFFFCFLKYKNIDRIAQLWRKPNRKSNLGDLVAGTPLGIPGGHIYCIRQFWRLGTL